MSKVKIIHHNDMDGRLSAYLVGRHYRTLEPEYIEASYETDMATIDVADDDIVWIVDFAFEANVMLELSKRVKLTYVDHHASTFKKFAEAGVDLVYVAGIRDESKAACVLTYEYLRDNTDSVLFPPSIPHFIKLVGDFDAWIGEFGDEAFYLIRGLEARDTSPTSDVWQEAWDDALPFIENGELSEAWFGPFVKQLIKEFAFECEFPPGYKCLAINAPGIRNSKYFERYAPGYDIWISYKYSNGAYSISIYSTTIDVSEIAQQYWYNGRCGGGHKGAAGFRIEHPPFLDVVIPAAHPRSIIMKRPVTVLTGIRPFSDDSEKK